MVIFGGYVRGSRTDDLYIFDIGTSTWDKVEVVSGPCIRTAHASTVVGDNLYIFGGQDEENCKL